MNEPVLESGAQGEWVTYLQQLLAQNGFDAGTVDGRFGDDTRTALEAFQRANGLLADGVAGQATWSALTGEDAVSSLDPDAVPEDLVAAGAPASLSEWSEQQMEDFFEGRITQYGDADTPEEVPLLAMRSLETEQGGFA